MAGRWPILAGWRGVGGHREACRGLAVDRRGRAWPWPWPAAASSGAATEQRPDGKQGSGSFGDGRDEFGRRRDGGGGAAWQPQYWKRERLGELEEACAQRKSAREGGSE